MYEDIWKKLYCEARKVQKERVISPFIEAGGVAAALLTKKGSIYVGVCIDTASTLGMCAERNAIANMITNGEHQIDKMVAVVEDGSVGAPCGACREYMMQLDKDSGDIETTGLPVTIVMLPENSSIWNDIVDVTDKEKFYRGESAICFFMSLAEISDGSVQVVDSDMKEKITGTEIALHDGEMLSLKAGDHNIQVKCERVIDHLNTINVDTNITPGTIFVSEKLYCQLFDMDSLKYNEVIAYGNHHASYDVTDKLMSMINRNQSITFNNHRTSIH